MNMIAIATNSTPQSARFNHYDATTVIALTLVQAPRYAVIKDERWKENAELIIHARNGDWEQDIDLLLEEVARLKREIEELRGE